MRFYVDGKISQSVDILRQNCCISCNFCHLNVANCERTNLLDSMLIDSYDTHIFVYFYLFVFICRSSGGKLYS